MKTDITQLKNRIRDSLLIGDAQAAKTLAVRLCKKAPKDAQSWVYLASTSLQLGEFLKAEEASARAIKLDASDSYAHLALVRSQFGQGKLAEASATLKRLLVRFPSMSDARGLFAEILFKLAEFEEAEQQFKMILAGSAGHVPALQGLQRVLWAANKREEALEVSRLLLQTHRLSPEQTAECAQILSALGQFQDAESTIKNALRGAPAHPALLTTLADVYQSQNRFREAVDVYRQALKVLPNAAGLHVDLGRALQKQGMASEAIECHRRALQLDAGHAAAYHNLGICLYKHDEPSPALRAFTQALEHAPDLALARVYAAILHSRLNEEAIAEGYWREIREKSPEWMSIFESYSYMRQAAPEALTVSLAEPLLTYAMQQASAEGLVLEFGVFYGNSIRMLAQASQDVVHGFDSFQGLPVAWEVDSAKEVVEAAGTYTMHGMLPEVPDNVRLHVGLFGDSLPSFLEEHRGPIRLLHIDCDLYASTVTIFEQLGDRIQPGTVIVFDEYLCYPNWREDEYRAFQEFITRSKLDYRYIAYSLFTGQAAVLIQ